MKRIILDIDTSEEIVNCDDCALFSRCYTHYDCPLYSLLADEDEAESSIVKIIKTEKI